MAAVQPTALKPIFRPTDDEDTVMPPGSDQDVRSIADANGEVFFSGPTVGPVGSRPGVKGQGERYIYPFYSGATSQRRGGVDQFAKILPELARGILEQATQRKIDIVFVIDASGSMRDNVRGVKDYVHHFLEPLEEQGFDTALGLVEFTDLEVTEAKVVGLTQSQKKFRKWLDRVTFFGGRDIPESGYEALIAAIEGTDFRDDAQKFFMLISDAPQHDLDYDGKSKYSLDRIIARLNDEGVRVNVVGANYLSMKQLAWGTGGQWKHIPGGDPFTDVPHSTSSMIRSGLGRSLLPVLVEDKVTVEFESSAPDWVDLSCKMLDPRGFKCLGTLTYRKKIYHKEEKRVDFSPKIDLSKFGDRPGTYTLIYRIRDSIGNRDILRRTLELRRK
jgi:Mg-chelatase subunit ChlD